MSKSALVIVCFLAHLWSSGAERDVEQYRLYGSEGEGELLDTWSGIGLGHLCERQMILDVRDLRGPLASQLALNADGGTRLGVGAGDQHQERGPQNQL